MKNFDSSWVLWFHHFLLSDLHRTHCYEKAIAAVVKPGDVVVDIGTGVGILAFFACRSGASRVYAIESNPAIELAKLVASRNGLADHIIFINKFSYDVELPERVDVLITETGAAFGLQGGMLGAIVDGRSRFLKENGHLLPESVEMLIAPIECRELHDLIQIWSPDLYGFDFSAGRSYAANSLFNSGPGPESLLGPQQSLIRINFAEASGSYVRGEAVCAITKTGTLDGFAGWHITEVAAGLTFTNSPVDPTVRWKHSLIPLERPVNVEPGDVVRVAVSSNEGREWRWTGEVQGRRGESKVKFDQFTLCNFPISPEQLQQASLDYTPKFSRRCEAALRLLELVKLERTSREMEQELAESYPDQFRTPLAARRFMGEILDRCGS